MFPAVTPVPQTSGKDSVGRQSNVRAACEHMFVMWPETTRLAVLELVASGVSDRVAARLSGVPRSTVAAWRRKPERSRRFFSADPDWRPVAPTDYCYVLGLVPRRRLHHASGRQRLLADNSDALYPRVIGKAENSLAELLPDRRVACYRHPVDRKVVLQVAWATLPYAFPRRRPRPEAPTARSELVAWQLELHAAPTPSDSADPRAHPLRRLSLHQSLRHEAPERAGRPVRVSALLLHQPLRRHPRIFCDHCDLLGIRWTQSNQRNISVSHRDSVALLDSFVGPKR